MKRYQSSCDECGWVQTKPSKSSGLSDYAYQQHSCRKHRRAAAAKIRGMRRRSRIDRTPNPCLHKSANHQHGTHACYVLDRCRCRPCAKANAGYEQQRVRRNAYGRSNIVDAQPVRDHVATLVDAGISIRCIVLVSGVSRSALRKLVNGKRRWDGTVVASARVTRKNADALLALDPLNGKLLADGTSVNPVGTQRRLQALGTLGWSVAQLAGAIGVNRQVLDRALDGRPVLARTARAVEVGYDRLWNTPAPQSTHRERIAASRVRRRAADNRWAPPPRVGRRHHRRAAGAPDPGADHLDP